MQAMLEQIALTEKEAENIRLQAAQQAKDSISKAKEEAERAVAKADQSEREKTKEAQKQAELDGEALGQSLIDDAAERINYNKKLAEDNIPEAVKYLIEKVENLA